MNTVKEVADYLKLYKQVFLYGAGKYAMRIKKQIEKYGVVISGYIVTERGNNPNEIDGKKVWIKDELIAKDVYLTNTVFVISFAGNRLEQMEQFMDCGLKDILFLKPQFYTDLFLNIMCDEYNELQEKYEIDISRNDMEEGQGVVIEKQTKLALFRVPKYNANLAEAMAKYCTRELFEKEYGKLSILPHDYKANISVNVAQKYGTEMYVITSHLDTSNMTELKKIGYIPLQVGAALTEIRKGCFTDNVGDNISVKNRDYCECTGLYWIWKNTQNQNYVGMSHYRRRLELNDFNISILNENKIGAVLPLPQFCTNTIEEFFYTYIGKCDWQYLKEAVIAYDSEYEVIFKEHEKSHFYFPCNVFLMQRKWFDKYCEFAFGVADRVEAEYKKRGIIRQDRYMGYLFENLTSVFVKRYYEQMNVFCSEIEWIK